MIESEKTLKDLIKILEEAKLLIRGVDDLLDIGETSMLSYCYDYIDITINAIKKDFESRNGILTKRTREELRPKY